MHSGKNQYKYLIVGNGLIGCAAARHLSQLLTDEKILLVGPDEPLNWTTHRGVFASHYDSGRITRVLDSDYVWALLAKRSIERYQEIEQASGIDFAHMVGCLKAAPDTDWGRSYIAANAEVGNRLGIAHEKLSSADLQLRFPYFNFAKNTIAIFETTSAGWIDPRKMLRAQNVAAAKAGVEICRETVINLRRSDEGLLVTTNAAKDFLAENLLVAAGAFSNYGNLIESKLQMTIRAETTVLGEVAQDHKLHHMPSLIYFTPESKVSSYVYLVPPVVYPDGRCYIKIGGDSAREHTFVEQNRITEWFHSHGDQNTKAAFSKELLELFPSVKFLDWLSKPCVITDTTTERPYIGKVDKNIFVGTGGCGAAAKSADEIGRLAALAMTGGSDDTYGSDAFQIATDNSKTELESQRKFHF